MTTTTTIPEPAATDTRELRALELYRTRGHEIRQASPGQDLYLVPSEASTGRGFYSVDYHEETCDCPDFLYSGENCKHILALAIAIAKGRIVHPQLAAGDPFIAGGKNRPCACNNGWVSVGYMVEGEDGEEIEEFALYLCRRCASEAGR